jgi:hypothetical protein
MRERRKKEKTVTLVTLKGDKQVFEVQHAERILDMGPARNGGWSVDPESEYIYDEEYGLRLKTNTGDSAKA